MKSSNPSSRIFLGYDPGGIGANGAAILTISPERVPEVRVGTFDHVDEVLRWFRTRAADQTPEAAGIDSFLSWSSGRSGWRPMDEYLRQEFPRVRNSVFSSNSAAGSMAIQGMGMAIRLRQVWPTIHLNETHPKVLYYALAQRRYYSGDALVQWLVNLVGLDDPPAITNDHEWDALISAWATLQGLDGTWCRNLMPENHDMLIPSGRVSYFWPDQAP